MSALVDEIGRLRWYHTIALPGGVQTPGFYNTVKGASRVPLPASLEGKRCLDIASNDGFWAFEMERRGAREVVAIDLPDPRQGDWPGEPPAEDPGPDRAQATFEIARQALGSGVEREYLSVYELSRERLGSFDFVFIGNVLLHLRDPVGALTAAHSVVDGELFSVDTISIVASIASPRVPAAILSRRPEPWWWVPNLAAYRRYCAAAGFEITARGGPFFFPFGAGFWERPPVRRLAAHPMEAWFWTVGRRFGAPSAWVRAQPTGAGRGTPRT